MKLFFVFTGYLLCTLVNAQDVLRDPDILPHSPEAASLAKNINIPVSYSSGTPQISIPFYTVRSGQMELPVSLSYNASGIRVDEVATWVGLGWNLNAGGQITRTVRGSADERPFYGYMNVPANRKVKYVNIAHCRCVNGSGETWAIENDIINYQLDLEPDQFSFSVLDYSGDFYFNQDSGKYILVPYQNIHIEGRPGSFILTLPNGIRAYFGCNTCEEELSSGTTTSYIDGVAESPEPVLNTPQGNSWMLAQLKDPIGRSIDFSYSTENIITFGRGGERFGPSISNSSNSMRRQSFYKQFIRKPVLRTITGDNVTISFKGSGEARSDMPDYMGGSRSLEAIIIKTRNGVELRTFIFQYGYFTSADYNTTAVLDIAGFAEVAGKRMFLKSITEQNGEISLPPYEFSYNEMALPSRFSTAQDYWGYYNGRNNGPRLMPKIPALAFYPWSPEFNETNKILPVYGSFLNNDGADRRIDSNFSQAGILIKIKYPSGGSTTYDYEQNTAAPSQLNIYGGMIPPDMEDKVYNLSSISAPLPDYPPYPLYFSGTLQIKDPATRVRVTPQLANCSTNPVASCKLMVSIRSISSGQIVATFNTTLVRDLPLQKGKYLIEVSVNGSSNDVPPYFNLNFQWGERRDSLNMLVGGVRVRKIVSRDGVNNTISRSFSYLKESSMESSGIIEGCPSYKVHDLNSEMELFRQYYVSNSILPLTADGKTVRYGHVTEYYDSAKTSFKTSYTFSSGITEPFYFARALTGAPRTTWNWQNNLLSKKQVYEKTSAGAFRIIAAEENFSKTYKPEMDLYGLYGPQIIPYHIATEWHLPDSVTSFHYSYAAGTPELLRSGVKYFYNHTFLPSVTRTSNSKGEIIDSRTWYPVDYNQNASVFISSLYGKRIWTVPVKQETSINGKLISGGVITYNNNGLPLQGYAYENASVPDTSIHNASQIIPANYKWRSAFAYDSRNHLKQVSSYKNGPGIYIWDHQLNAYNGTLMNDVPVAVIQNADSNSVAYTSFENHGKGNWDYSGEPRDATTVMGSKAYSLSSGPIKKSGLGAGSNYIISYWSNVQQNVSFSSSVKKGNTINGWTFYEHKISSPAGGVITVSGIGLIDELRLYPEKAQMTSYAYNQFWVVRSVCDINNRITHYEYDLLGRLSLVRDAEGNILKKYCYNYSGQPQDCGLGSDPHWQLSEQYCEKDGEIYTGHLVQVERDINPKSSSYNTTREKLVRDSPSCTSSENCTGIDKKMINGVCESGKKVYVASERISSTSWICYYYFVWSDDSESEKFEEYHTSPCTF